MLRPLWLSQISVSEPFLLDAAPNSFNIIGSTGLPSQCYCCAHPHFPTRFKLAERAFQKCMGRLCSDHSDYHKSAVLSRFYWRFTCTTIEKRQGRSASKGFLLQATPAQIFFWAGSTHTSLESSDALVCDKCTSAPVLLVCTVFFGSFPTCPWTVVELNIACDTAVQFCRTLVTSQPPQRAPRVWFSLVSPSGRPIGLFEYLGVRVYRLVTANWSGAPKSVVELNSVGYK